MSSTGRSIESVISASGRGLPELPELIGTSLGRLVAATQNALEIARFGGLDIGEGGSPYVSQAAPAGFRLRHYFPAEGDGSPILLVPPLMLAAEVYDVTPTCGVVHLRGAGFDPWVIDFGRPEQEEGGLERRVEDHVRALGTAIDAVHEATGRSVHVAGYSQGGMFAYQAAALRQDDAIASLITFGSAVDTRAAAPFGLSPESMAKAAALMASGPLGGMTVPGWVSRLAFQVIDPGKNARQRLDFVRRLHDRESLLTRERQRRFLDQDGYVSWPGPAVSDLMRDAIRHNRMLQGGLVVDGRALSLADITVPILAFVGSVDNFTPPESARGIARAAPLAKTYEREVPAGHFGLVVGSKAAEHVWPTVCAWVEWRERRRKRPREIRRIDTRNSPPAGGAPKETELGFTKVLSVGVSAAKTAAGAAVDGTRSLRDLAGTAQAALPALSRVASLADDTRISMSLLIEEHARRRPDAPAVVYDDRVRTYAAADQRIDAVLAGLLKAGVRRGERVGVLMETRPSAFVVIGALNRIGAISVLFRPDGDPAQEAVLARTSRVAVDADHIEHGLAMAPEVLLVGNEGAVTAAGPSVIDVEALAVDAGSPPAWYTPSPGRSRDAAFVLFAGTGDGTRMLEVTNGRWALSAFGTASAAALGEGDTLYTATPLHHSSTLLMTVGGAIAGGSRVAFSPGYEPDRFWREVRRYGVTVASYTWTMLGQLADAPPDPAERHHGLRLVIGSGMPAGLWKRVAARLAPARVVEFYASAANDVILVNVSGAKCGSVGRPLPGAAQVKVVAWDLERDRLATGPDGFGRLTGPDEVGMLIAWSDPGSGLRPGQLSGVLAPGDAWTVTGDLFRRDADGDLWLVEPGAQLVRTSAGTVSGARAQAALERLAQVDLAVAYGIPAAPDSGHDAELLVVALTLRPNMELPAEAVDRVIRRLAPPERPQLVHVLQELPLTRTYRPDVATLIREQRLGRTLLDRRPVAAAAAFNGRG